jgi:ABC-2 type transport system permease protein
VIPLLLHSLRRVRTLVLAIGGLLALLQVILVLVAGSIQNSGQFAQLAKMFPPFVRALMGPALTAFLSFGGIVSLGYFEPGVIFAVIGLSITVGTRLAVDVESGFVDVLLARPIPRHRLVTVAILTGAVSLALPLLLMLGGTWIGLATLAPTGAELPAPAMILRLAANLGLLGLAWNSIALAIASGARRRGVASGIAGVLALVTFLLDYVARIWDAAKGWAWLSPFTYFSPLEMVTGGELHLRHVMVLAGIAALGWVCAYVVFLRRDISR